MKRGILFKAVVKYNGNHLFSGDWVCGSLLLKSNRVFIYVIEEDEFGNIVREFEVEVHPETVCQFTGLLDKNGNKIFEGDIVDAWNQGSHLTNGIIRWGIGTCKFFIGNESNSIVWNLCGTGKQYIQEDLEIIGNIHD